MPLVSPIEPVSVQREEIERIGQKSGLDELPAVRAYLNRIGATAIDFRTAVVRENAEGYPRTVGRVTFAPDGKASVTGSASAPNDEEQTAIVSAFGNVQFPKIMTLAALADLPPGVTLSDPLVHVCHDFDGRIAMLQQRYNTRDGGKGYLSWTRWSDGLWRNMEPETLPFFGLPGHERSSTLVIHEGAKGAARIKRMQSGQDEPEGFPWWPELRHAHHVGWLGGVFAIHRSDWPRLAALRWQKVVVVADNEENGFKAAQSVASHFGSNVWILAFDQRFKPGFDLADPWPVDFFSNSGTYVGPPMRDFLLPATQATVVLPAEGRGRPTVVLREEFARLVAYTVEPPRIIFLHNPSRDYRPEQFNTLIAPLSHVKETAPKVFRRAECQHLRMVYRPGFAAGTINDRGRCFNVFEGPGIAPIHGNPNPWLEYLDHLFPDPDDREHVARWLATLIAMPRTRVEYGLLLISMTQGVGKSTLGAILRLVLGPHNVSFPSETSIVESQFNSWLARKRLIFVHEFYSGHSRKAYDKLKPYITDPEVPINEKGIPEYAMENWAHFIACSNSEAALHLDDEDRRWLVPTVTEVAKPRLWWADFHAWLEGEGPGIILRWANEYVAGGNHVRTGDHAPQSKRKRSIIEGSRSEGQQLAVAFGEHLTGLGRKVILRTRDIRAWIALQRGFRRGDEPDLGDRRLEKPDTILRALKRVPGITVWGDARRPKFGATRDSIVMNFAPASDDTWAELKALLTDLKGVSLDEPF